MNLEFGILSGAFLLGAIGFLMNVAGFFKQRGNSRLIGEMSERVEELENSLAANKEKLDAAVQRAVDQSRRVAWLEMRVRQPKLAKKEILDEAVLAEKSEDTAPTLSITERRHRVLHLASRGQKAETIASTLGMLTGEVELIVNLNQADYARFS